LIEGEEKFASAQLVIRFKNLNLELSEIPLVLRDLR